MRAVAAGAEVDPAMVFYFFGTKQGLFSAALEMSADMPPAIESIFAGDPDGIGERIVRALVGSLDRSDRTPLGMLARSAPTHDRSQALLREFIDRGITGRISALLDAPDATLRAGMVNASRSWASRWRATSCGSSRSPRRPWTNWRPDLVR